MIYSLKPQKAKTRIQKLMISDKTLIEAHLQL